ncbi:cytochrome c-type biogenesis protein [Bifidobacterium leontopitheci]|uniref:Uncharacterized protein n=1 Tax=Bifidobacterium leontopitheci TaxID=2650774 RepID=A0A6I1GPM4_9BIFI|nr:hypothetical protein [Bifidobacterium leontopitheci]KAB7791446.1 hypothetical protein F7D09_0121 [Bifidobacterium leontopitheci]
MTDENKPVRGISTIQKELDEQEKSNSYKTAFAALGVGAALTLFAFIMYQPPFNTIYVWAWIAGPIALLCGVIFLVTAKSEEEKRHQKIAQLREELAEARRRDRESRL